MNSGANSVGDFATDDTCRELKGTSMPEFHQGKTTVLRNVPTREFLTKKRLINKCRWKKKIKKKKVNSGHAYTNAKRKNIAAKIIGNPCDIS